MGALLLRTVSQTLQAALPIAVALGWLRHVQADRLSRAVRRAVIAALLLTPAAGYFFNSTNRQAQLEASLAWASVVTVALATVSLLRLRRDRAPGHEPGTLAVAAAAIATIFLILRQTMEIAVVLQVAVLQLRSLDSTLALTGGILAGLLIAALAYVVARHMPTPIAARSVALFGLLIVIQAMVYGFHESAESNWLPSSEAIHAATEIYGPEGFYGQVGALLVGGVPILLAFVGLLRDRGSRSRAARWLAGGAAVAAVLVVGVLAWRSSTAVGRDSTPVSPTPSAGASTTTVSSGELLFRRTNLQDGYGKASAATIDPRPGAPASSALACERLSFAGGHGLCLQAERRLFTTYRAVQFDEHFTPLRTLPLAGSPSRTRVSSDGRIGAATVFDTAVHSYSTTTFSTVTTLIDMGTGDVIGNLEEFPVWRDGQRFKAIDFNFWGVTFARDPNTFYATLRTDGKTYLVKGDLGLRKLTVVRENVECPSISPDNQRLAFKKRVGEGTDPWRLYVLDLTTMAEQPISSETRSIDDQVEWLDDGHVLYGVPRAGTAVTDIWVAPLDGSAPAAIFLPEASSPIVVR